MNRSPIKIELSKEERKELERRARSLSEPHRSVVRAKLILLLETGLSVSAVARQVGRRRRIVERWGQRFLKKRLVGLEDNPRSGRPARFSPRSGDRVGETGLRAP